MTGGLFISWPVILKEVAVNTSQCRLFSP